MKQMQTQHCRFPFQHHIVVACDFIETDLIISTQQCPDEIIESVMVLTFISGLTYDFCVSFY